MSVGNCRWGILGTAGIARKNWKAIRLAGNASVVAVASRNETSASRFINECSAQVPFEKCPEAVGSYEALLARKDIDAVYIPLPTALRREWVIKAAEAGKYVLGEKPAALNATEVRKCWPLANATTCNTWMASCLCTASGCRWCVRSLMTRTRLGSCDAWQANSLLLAIRHSANRTSALRANSNRTDVLATWGGTARGSSFGFSKDKCQLKCARGL